MDAVGEDDAGIAFVVADGVGAIAEDENREIVGTSKIISFGNIFGLFDFDNISCWATKTHGGKARNQNVFTDSHTVIILYL